MKYTVLVRGLIRVPCKRVNHVAMEPINDNEEDPFKLAEPTEEDREAAHPAILLVDEDTDADAEIDIY